MLSFQENGRNQDWQDSGLGISNSAPKEQILIVDDTIANLKLTSVFLRESGYVTKKGKIFWGSLAAKKIQVAGQQMNLVRVTDITRRRRSP